MTVTDTSAPAALPAAREEFEAFYRQAWPGAVRLAGLLTQQPRSAEDIAQEAFTRVYPKWAGVENPTAYLRMTIVNVCRSWGIRQGAERTKLAIVGVPESVALDFDILTDAVASLPYRERAVLVLRYYADLSEAEIAQALDCRPGTVKSLASRALATLKKGIEQ
jgi:RNA polymerase sigma-70 factor (sigma-E family)